MANSSVSLSTVLEAHENARRLERKRLSQFLHDETGSLLSGVALQLESLRMDGVEGLEQAIQSLEKLFESVRGLSQELHPDIAEQIGLYEALKVLATSAALRFSGRLLFRGDPAARGPAAMYRIAEEALDNAVRHSRATQIELILDAGGLLVVRDNGVGFDRGVVKPRLGLWLIGYLAREARLGIRMKTARGRGTIIEVFVSDAV
jgi:signal transduction histidine kinase